MLLRSRLRYLSVSWYQKAFGRRILRRTSFDGAFHHLKPRHCLLQNTVERLVDPEEEEAGDRVKAEAMYWPSEKQCGLVEESVQN